jgi:hypothetical protein
VRNYYLSLFTLAFFVLFSSSRMEQRSHAQTCEPSYTPGVENETGVARPARLVTMGYRTHSISTYHTRYSGLTGRSTPLQSTILDSAFRTYPRAVALHRHHCFVGPLSGHPRLGMVSFYSSLQSASATIRGWIVFPYRSVI